MSRRKLFLLMTCLLTGFLNLTLQGEEQTERDSLSQSAVEIMKSYPVSFRDSSLKISPIYPIDKSGLHRDLITVGEDLELSLSDESLQDLSTTTCNYEGDTYHCPHCLNENEICDYDQSCVSDQCCCCCCCCCDETDQLTGLAAVGLGGRGLGGYGGGFAATGYFGVGGGGGGGGGGDNGGDGDDDGGGGGETPIPEPSTLLILGGMTTLSVYLRRKREKNKSHSN